MEDDKKNKIDGFESISDNSSEISDSSLKSENNELIDNREIIIDNSTSNDDLFFEKFNTTKKNYKKQQLEKARKSINKKNKSLSFERRLENNRYLLKIYLILLGVMFFILAMTITTFVINFPFYNGNISNDNAWFGISTYIKNDYLIMNRAIVVMDGIAFSILPIPFFFLLCTWFVGLNQVFRSRKFIILLVSVVGLSLLISLLTIPMFSVIYSKHTFLDIK